MIDSFVAMFLASSIKHDATWDQVPVVWCLRLMLAMFCFVSPSPQEKRGKYLASESDLREMGVIKQSLES